jgi:hypothetical protein
MNNSASSRSFLATAGLALPAVSRAFVVHQASPKAAIQVMQKLRDRFKDTEPAKTADDAFQANDRYLGRLLIFRKGAYVAGFVNLTHRRTSHPPLAAAIP